MDQDESPVSTAQAIAGSIRELIFSGTYSPGDRIVEQDLALRFGVSRGPVREAIRLLAAERVVVLFKNRGARVAVPTLDDVLEVYALRLRLGNMAIQHLIESATHDAVATAHLHEMAGTLAASDNRGRQLAMVDADLGFQSAIVQSSGLHRTSEIFSTTAIDIRLFVQVLHIPYDRRNHRELVDRHRALLAAIDAHDVRAAEDLWTEHTRITVREFSSFFFTKNLPASHPLSEQIFRTA